MFQKLADAERRTMHQEDSVLNNPWSGNKKVPKAAADEARHLLEHANDVLDCDVVVVGAGPAGIGVVHALLLGGLAPSQIRVLEAKGDIGASFREWPETTQFVTPSFGGHHFGVQDLNAVVPDTVVSTRNSHYPTGIEYADYLETLMRDTNVTVDFFQEVSNIEERSDKKFDIQTTKGRKITCASVVWCGGEWNAPTKITLERGAKVPDDCVVHYKNVVLRELLSEAAENDDFPIVLVGGGEAGADLACALVREGASRVLVVDASLSTRGLDLSPVTHERLERLGNKNIEFWTGTKCVGIYHDQDDAGKLWVELLQRGSSSTNNESAPTKFRKVATRSKVVFCTGFDISCDPILEEWFDWEDDGRPMLDIQTDESSFAKGIFLAGPSVVHHNHRFASIYQYRTRFAVVASEIIRRVLRDRHFVPRWSPETSEMRLVLTPPGQKLYTKCQQMREFYRTKGLLLEDPTDLEGCGMMGRCRNHAAVVDTTAYDTDETAEHEDDEPAPFDYPVSDGDTAASGGTEATECL